MACVKDGIRSYTVVFQGKIQHSDNQVIKKGCVLSPEESHILVQWKWSSISLRYIFYHESLRSSPEKSRMLLNLLYFWYQLSQNCMFLLNQRRHISESLKQSVYGIYSSGHWDLGLEIKAGKQCLWCHFMQFSTFVRTMLNLNDNLLMDPNCELCLEGVRHEIGRQIER